jgi:hypothetical protein
VASSTLAVKGYGRLTYSLSNSLYAIEKAILTRTGRSIALEDAEWEVNTNLAPVVQDLMHTHNVNYSMTITSDGCLVVNQRAGTEWHICFP